MYQIIKSLSGRLSTKHIYYYRFCLSISDCHLNLPRLIFLINQIGFDLRGNYINDQLQSAFEALRDGDVTQGRLVMELCLAKLISFNKRRYDFNIVLIKF